MKDFKHRHGANLYKGQDARSNSTLIDQTKKKYMQKVRESNSQDKDHAKNKAKFGRSFGDKAMNKIQMASRPTRSKMIVRM